MNITLNGDPYELVDGSTAQRLIEQLDLVGKRLAMEINQEIVPRSTFEEHQLQANDHVEIVHAIGGG
ncbi:MAG: sulfur carrier protein ThiS [Gammaproteobacteria bacterium]|nr:sulfur carrier protein ThiS [Gammaproteobacteria bacterium]